MKIHFSLVMGMLAALPANAGAPWWQALGPVEKGAFGGGHFDDGEHLSPSQKDALARKDFEEWVDYEDEWVKLRYPKHPEVKFRVSKGGDGLKVEGGVVTTVDNSFQQAYVLEVGKATYGVILLQPAEWLDDGICLCGPMVHHGYSMRDGCLVRYSMLPGGAVKKAQVLGGGLRLMAFEWTHLACTREVYEKLVDGMTLKFPHPETEAGLRERIAREYGMEGRAGWLHPGQSMAEMAAVMGEPGTRKEGRVVWKGVHADYPQKLEAEVIDGKLAKFITTGVEQTGGPVEGSLTWVEEQSKKEAPRVDDDVWETDGEKPGADKIIERPSPERLAADLRKLASECRGYRWRIWCECVLSLAKERGHRDSGLFEILRERSTGLACELEALEFAEIPGLKEWVGQGLSKLVAGSSAPGKDGEPDEGSRYWRQHDAEALLAWQAEHDEASLAGSAAKLLAARQPEWAAAVLGEAKQLSPELVTGALVQALGFACEERDGDQIEDILDQVRELEIGDPAAVRKAVEQVPAGKAGSEWNSRRQEALDDLEARSAAKAKSRD